LLEKVPQSRCLRILEAGVCTLQQIQQLESMGVHGVMVGDALLDEFYPGKRLAQILAGVEIPKKPIKTKGRQDLLQDPSAKAVKPAKAAAGSHEASRQKTGGKQSSTHTPQPAREGKKEFPMEQIHPDETSLAVASVPAETAAAPKKPAARKPAVKKPAAKKPAAKKPAVKKPAAKKAPVKKAVAKKAPVKKAVAKKAVAKKPAAKKAVAKK
jgi:hypothetical protein